MSKALVLHAVNSGIAFTVPLTGMNSLMLRMLTDIDGSNEVASAWCHLYRRPIHIFNVVKLCVAAVAIPFIIAVLANVLYVGRLAAFTVVEYEVSRFYIVDGVIVECASVYFHRFIKLFARPDSV